MSASTPVKVQLLGSAGVGKTSLLTKYTTGQFTTDYRYTSEPITTSFDFKGRRFDVTDTPGQSVADYTLPPDTNAVISMFDLTSVLSFNTAVDRCNQVLLQNPVTTVVLVGNKSDCHSKVTEEMIRLRLDHWYQQGSIISYCGLSVKGECDQPLTEIQLQL